MATIKAGTYRFNDVLSVSDELSFYALDYYLPYTIVMDESNMTCVKIDELQHCNFIVQATETETNSFMLLLLCDYLDSPEIAIYGVTNNWGWCYFYNKVKQYGFDDSCELYKNYGQTIIISTDQEVSDEFSEWFAANAIEVVEDLDYLIKSSTLTAIANSIRTKTGKTDNIAPTAMPEEILSFASDATAEPEHILKGFAAYGKDGKIDGAIETYDGESSDITEVVGGECSGVHIIEVTELPTENIDESALYSCDGKYYKYGNAGMVDVIIVDGGDTVSYAEFLAGAQEVSFNTIPTKITDALPTKMMEDIFHLYFIEDENDVFFYGEDGSWVSLSELNEGAFGGVITSVSEATTDGCLYVLMGTGWIEYLSPSGTMKVTENGTHDVSGYAKVAVDVYVPDAPTTEEKSVTPTKETQEVTASNADYLSKVTVAPIPSEYVKPEGTKDIDTNGTHDVSNYAEVEVNVPIPDGYIVPSGDLEITENGTHDIKEYESVTVNVASTGGGAIDLDNIPEVDTIENPTDNSPLVVRHNGEIYLLIKE